MRGRIEFKGGLIWHVAFNEDHCRNLAIPFFRIMQPMPFRQDGKGGRNEMHFFVKGGGRSDSLQVAIPAAGENEINFILGTTAGDEALDRQMMRLSQGMAHCSASPGAILLHGALASWKCKGVLLCGASGSGKTTASKRLPSSWRSLSDDATFLVRDKQGGYWAHPWPTWSRHPSQRRNSIQPLAGPVRLHAICFLKKSVKDGISSALPKESVVRLMAASEQAVNLMAGIIPVSPRNKQRIDRLDLCCALARKIPVFHLSASLTGNFWELIEKVLMLHVPR